MWAITTAHATLAKETGNPSRTSHDTLTRIKVLLQTLQNSGIVYSLLKPAKYKAIDQVKFVISVKDRSPDF